MYPDTPGYQKISDTSREAADKVAGTAERRRQMVLAYIKGCGEAGATIDETAAHFSDLKGAPVYPNAISGRFKELEELELICKTPLRRKTRSGSRAVVYLAGKWTDRVAAMPDPVSHPETPASQIAIYKAKQAVHGHGYVIPRNDGTRRGCGGPSICRDCKQAKAYFEHMQAKEMAGVV